MAKNIDVARDLGVLFARFQCKRLHSVTEGILAMKNWKVGLIVEVLGAVVLLASAQTAVAPRNVPTIGQSPR